MRETPQDNSKPSTRRTWLILGLVIVVSIAGYFLLRAKNNVPVSEASVGTEIFGDRKIMENSSIISFPEVVRRAKAGDPKWQLALGDAYFEGKLQLKDDIEAIKWITLASDAGHIPAHVRLGYLYDHTPGTLQNEQLAFKFRLEAGKLRLIGSEEDSFSRNQGDRTLTSTNHLTGKIKTTSGLNQFDEKESRPKVTWENLESKKPVYLEDLPPCGRKD